ncbi:MAG TPA: UvrB/UvrC motif-containing protein, partial [Alphaproteobacteria bacterium]|nr:UvrB/UvrC motif-containing protein [Alphaproteobacteria bacterium]
PAFPAAREKLDRALRSDQYWWASARPWWSIEMIERGAKELYDAVLAIPKLPDDTRERARHLYHTIVFTAFDWQRSGLVDQLAHQEDEEVRQMTDTGLPKLPKGEVDKMIAHLQEEMKLVADRQEYERAAQIRDRIKELKTYIAETPAPVTSPEGDREFKLNA